MNEVIALKTGGAGDTTPPKVRSFSPADVADFANGVHSTPPVEGELL